MDQTIADEKVLKIQQRLRAQLSQATAFDERCRRAPLVAFEEVAGVPAGAEDIVHRVVAELCARGLRVATLRHYAPATAPEHVAGIAKPYLQAGSQATMFAMPGKTVLSRPCEGDLELGDLLDLLGDGWDLVVCESFSLLPVPKLLVTKRVKEGFNLGLSNVIGYVGERDPAALIPHFDVDDTAGIADLVERRVLGREPAPRQAQENGAPAGEGADAAACAAKGAGDPDPAASPAQPPAEG